MNADSLNCEVSSCLADMYLKRRGVVPNAMNNYAVMLKNGNGIPVDKSEAARYFKMAADNGCVISMNAYAVMQYAGSGVQINNNTQIYSKFKVL